jgi:hypothetical protein
LRTACQSALEAGNHATLKALRRQIHALNHEIRRHAAVA